MDLTIEAIEAITAQVAVAAKRAVALGVLAGSRTGRDAAPLRESADKAVDLFTADLRRTLIAYGAPAPVFAVRRVAPVTAARGSDAMTAVAHELRLQGIEGTPILAVARDDSVAPATTWDVTVVTDEG
jgi:hypothetical protein